MAEHQGAGLGGEEERAGDADQARALARHLLPGRSEGLGRVACHRDRAGRPLPDRVEDFLGRQGSRVLNITRQDHRVEQGEQGVELPGQVLLAGGPEDQQAGDLREAARQGLCQGPGRRAVVGPVDHDPGGLAEDLGARRHSRPAEALDRRLTRDLDPLLGQHIQGGQGDRGIERLVRAREGERQPAPVGPPGPHRDLAHRREVMRPRRVELVAEVPADAAKGGMPPGGDGLDGLGGFGVDYPGDGRPAALEDPGLLAGDQGQGVAELAGVVERDRGQDRD